MKKILIFFLISMLCGISSLYPEVEKTNYQETQGLSNSLRTGITAITIANQYPDYPATPGDIYNIDFLVANKEREIISAYVDRDYNIDLSFIGKVNVKGLIYSEVVQTLKDKISDSYPGSIVNVAIKSPGIFKVTLLGEVKEATIIDAMGITTLSEIINGRLTEYASLRDIEIRSEDGTLKVYDLFKFKRFADLKNNPFIKPNDVVTIRPYKKIVTITGEVRRPGTYQLLNDDTLETLVNFYADGLTDFADKENISLRKDNSDPLASNVKYIDANKEDLSEIKVSNYDNITVGNSSKYLPYITIQGAFFSSVSKDTATTGYVTTNKIITSIPLDTKLSTAINLSNISFNIKSDLENAYIERGLQRLPVDLFSVLREVDSKHDISLQNGDVLVIPFKELSVFVQGSVTNPGIKAYVPNKTAKYYIGLSGGYNREENLFKSYSITNVNGEKLKSNSIIGPEDIIWVNRDNPFSYLSEYSGWLTVILSIFLVADEIYEKIIQPIGPLLLK